MLTPTFLPVIGGAELVVLEVYRRLARRHAVRLITPVLSASLRREQGAADHDALVNFEVTRYADRCSLIRLRGHRWSAGALPPFSLSAVVAVRRAVAQFRPDVLNVHYVMPTGLAAVVAERVLGVPAVVTLNGRDVPGPGVPPLWRWWHRMILAAATDVTYVSGYCRDAVYGPGRGRGVVIPNGVDVPAPAGDGGRVRRDLEIPDGDLVVLALQRLAPEKRLDGLVRALRRCLDAGAPATLIVAGVGPEAPALRALAADLGVEKCVRWAGYVPRAEVADYFAAADVVAVHSAYETFGIVAAQGMSHGKPVVAVRTTALPEVVGEAGLLVPPGDPDAFGDALARLALDASLRARLGAAGRARAEQLFAWDAVAARYEAVLGAAAGRPR